MKVESTEMQERAQQLWRELDGLDWSSHEQAIVGILRDALEEERLEQFTRGRNWEIAEYKRHLIEHNPQIGGLCSWCKMEMESGRACVHPATRSIPCCQGWERHDITCAKYGQPK